MTFPSPSSDDSFNAFSMVSFEKTSELTRKGNLDDLEAPAVVREDAAMSTSTVSDTIYTCGDEYPLEDHSDCPLLQTVSVDPLPSRFIDQQLDGPPDTVEPSCIWAFMASPFAMALVAVSVSLSKEVSVHGINGSVAMGCIFAFFFGQILLILCLVVHGDYENPLAGEGRGLHQHPFREWNRIVAYMC